MIIRKRGYGMESSSFLRDNVPCVQEQPLGTDVAGSVRNLRATMEM